MKIDLPKANRRVLAVALYVLTAVSVVTAILNVSPAWQAPFVLVALIFVISMLTPVDEIHRDVRYLKNVKEAAAPSKTYSTQQELYRELERAVEAATSTLDLTHIRDQPPADFGTEAAEYSEAVLNWLRQSNDHSVRRIISVRSGAMMQYAKVLSKRIERFPHYHVKVVDWSIAAPALNMAIIDGKAVFLALTGDTFERTRGFAIEDETSAEYFQHYYAGLWVAATDLNEYLAKQLSG